MPELFNQAVTSPVLVGRARELLALQTIIDQAKGERGQIILLGGEAGVGKSRLLAEAQAYAVARGFFPLQMFCFPADSALPNAPLFEMLQSYLLPTSTPAYPAALAPILQELRLFFPELALSAQQPISLDPEQKKHRLFVLLTSFFSQLAAQQPIFLTVEDIHWSDTSTLEYLHYLMRRSIIQPMILLLTYRSDEVSVEFKQWLAQLDREHRSHELRLAPLSRDEVGRMLRAIFALDHSPPPEFLDAVSELTEGNPFFIEEVLKSLIASGAVALKDGRWNLKPINFDIPRSVQAAVQQRSDQLSAEAREVVELAAVMGRGFDFTVLQRLTRHSDAALLVVMKELVTAQLIVEESADRFVFRHALTRQALYSGLLARERHSLHLVIAQALEAVYAPHLERRAADLAYHFYEAGAWEQSLSYSLQAGEHALSLYALRPAVEHFSRAILTLQQLNRSVAPGLYRSRGLTYEMLGDFKSALSDLNLVLQQAEALQDQPAEWQALLDLGLLWAGQDYDQTGKYYQRAFELARSMNQPLALANSLNRLGNWHLNVERSVEAHWYHQEALAVFQELQDQRGIADTLDLLGMASYLGGDLVQGTRYYEKAVELFYHLDQRQGLVSSLATLAMRPSTYQTDTMVSAVSSFADPVQDAEKALVIAREIGHRSGEAYAMILLGMCVSGQGTYQRAFDLLENALALALEIEHRQWITAAEIALGALYAEVLTFPEAEQHLERALEHARDIQSLHWLRHAVGFLGLTYVQHAKLTEAEALLHEYLNPDLPARTLGQRLMWRAATELALARGEGELALQSVDHLLSSATNLSISGIIPRLSKLRGDALRLLGQDDAAKEELTRALEAAARQEASPLVWRIHVSLAQLDQTQSRFEEARQHANAALALLDQLATELPEALRDGFYHLALSYLPEYFSPVSAKPSRDDLTPREREIAVLLAQGKSNRQMAEQLVLSERTVETHVRNILSKLNFTSRTQVVLWAVEVGLINPQR